MRAVVQRVKNASVTVDGKEVSAIDRGLLVLVGLGKEDTDEDIRYLAGKIAGLRIFPEGGKEASVSVKDINGEVLIVSQFTLLGDVRKGRRPSYSGAMPPDKAKVYFDDFNTALAAEGVNVKSGVFQAMMDVQLVNDGPYTILLDSGKQF